MRNQPLEFRNTIIHTCLSSLRATSRRRASLRPEEAESRRCPRRRRENRKPLVPGKQNRVRDCPKKREGDRDRCFLQLLKSKTCDVCARELLGENRLEQFCSYQDKEDIYSEGR